jgi:acetyl-CoA C-acetyltransferase
MAERIVIAGWGQVTQPKDATPPFLDPIEMMANAARDASAVAGASVWQKIDTLLVVRPLSRQLPAPGEALALRLGIKAANIRVSGIGGETPQALVNHAAGMLARGESQAVLLCGAETYYPRAADAVSGEAALVQGIPGDYDADDAVGSNALEQRHGLTLPIHGFPLFEVALWAKSGLERHAWLARTGALWSGFSAVAATHPNAWTRHAVQASDLVTPSPANRLIAFPYTKRLVSLVMADLGAALLMTTERIARGASGGAATPVYFLGGAYARDRQRFMIDKADFTRSPALASVAEKAQRRSGLKLAEVEGFDLYSCFPCAVTVAKQQLGIADNDPRPLTQTGGLGFFGGPGSNYALHGIASLAANIAAGKLSTGMASALGWFMHKYAVGFYGARPVDRDLGGDDQEDLASPDAGDAPVPHIEAAAGLGTLETYTVIYNRDQSPQRGLLYGRTDTGLRFVANSPTDSETFARLTGENQVGARVSLSQDATRGVNLARLVD